jgi:WD40 repeat protein
MTSNAPGKESGQPSRAKVFISYSRKDMAFADRLEAALKARGLAPLIDRNEIFAFEEWWRRIEALIAGADTVVFVLSPDSVCSDVALKEIAFAASLNKRFAPIVCRRVDDKAVPEVLARLNFIFFEDEVWFEKSADKLAQALDTNIEWIRKHTEFGERGRRWALAKGTSGLLLRSPLLEEAETWIASRPEGAPAPTEETRAFVRRSRQAATRRRNVLTGSLAVGLILTLCLAGLAYWQSAIARAQRDKALLTQSRFLADLASQRVRTGDAATGMLFAVEGLPDTAGGIERPRSDEAEAALFVGWARLQEAHLLAGHTGSVSGIAFRPDGLRVVTSSDDGTARIWDAATGKGITVLRGHAGPVNDVAFTADGRRVVTASADGTARIWDADLGSEIAVLKGHEGSVNSAAFSPDGRQVLTASSDKTARIWSAETGLQIKVIVEKKTVLIYGGGDDDDVKVTERDGEKFTFPSKRTEQAEIFSANFSPDGQRVVTASEDHVRIWEVTTDKTINLVAEGVEPHLVKSAVFDPTGERVLTASADATVRIWDVKSAKEVFVFKGHEGPVNRAVLSQDGHRVLSASRDGTARIWDVNGQYQIVALAGHINALSTAAFSQDGRRVATASNDGTARIWKAAIDEPSTIIEGSHIFTTWAAFNQNGRRVATNGTHRIVDTETGGVVAKDAYIISGATLRPDGERLLMSGVISNVETGAKIVELEGKEHYGSGAFSPDGRKVIAAYKANVAGIFDAASGKRLALLVGHSDEVNNVAFSSDGRRAVTVSQDRTARVWDADTGQMIALLEGHTAPVLCAAFSADGQHLVTGSNDRTARLWDAESGEAIATIIGHTEDILGVIFTPDGRRVVTASKDGTLRMWDAATGRPFITFRQERVPRVAPSSVLSATFTLDGRGLMAALSGEEVKIWRVFPTLQDLIDNAKQFIPRCLTREQREKAFLDPEPPDWCIKMEKWPYQTQDWKDWVKFNRANLNPPLPDTPKWQAWLAAHQQGRGGSNAQ